MLHGLRDASFRRCWLRLTGARTVVFVVSTGIVSLSWPVVIAAWLLSVAVNRPFAITEALSAGRFVVPMVAMSAATLGASRKRADPWSWTWLGSCCGILVGTLLLAMAEYFRKGQS